MANRIVLNNFNLGGLSDTEYQGPPNSLSEMKGVDVHSEPGVLKASREMERRNVTTGTSKIDTLIRKILVDTDGDVWFFSGETTARIWQEAGTDPDDGYNRWTTADANLTTLSKVTDAVQFYNFIFYFHTTKIGYWKLGGNPSSTGHASSYYSALTNVDHVAYVKDEIMYVANGQELLAIEATADTPATIADFTAPVKVLDFGAESTITALSEVDTALLIAVKKTNGTSAIYRWDTFTQNLYDNSDVVPEYAIQAFIPVDNAVFVIANSGRIYQYDGYQLRLFKRIPYDRPTNKAISVTENAVGMFDYRSLIGVSQDQTGGSAGIYSLGGYSNSYPTVLVREFIPSPGTFEKLAIGAIAVKRTSITEQIYIAWQDIAGTGDNEYGVDKWTSTNDYCDCARIVSREIDSNRVSLKRLKIYINYAELPAGTDIILKVIENGGAERTISTFNDAKRKIKIADYKSDQVTSLQVVIELTTTASSTPAIESIFIDEDG